MRLVSWLMAGIVVGGYLVCRRLLEGDPKNLHSSKGLQVARRAIQPSEAEVVAKSSGVPRKKGTASGRAITLEKKVLKQVRLSPGLLQTELYGFFPGIGHKQLQGLLLRLDREGVLQRTPEKGTYRLFPVA